MGSEGWRRGLDESRGLRGTEGEGRPDIYTCMKFRILHCFGAAQ